MKHVWTSKGTTDLEEVRRLWAEYGILKASLEQSRRMMRDTLARCGAANPKGE